MYVRFLLTLSGKEESLADPTVVQRKIYFYWINFTERIDENRFRRRSARELIGRLGELDDLERQLERTDGDLTFSRTFIGQEPSRLRLSTVRLREIPRGFDRSDSSDFIVDMNEQQGLAEATHLMVFPRNIIGFEVHRFGPGVGRLEQYLKRLVLKPEETVIIEPLISKDFETKLENLPYLREMRVRVSSQQLEDSNQTDGSDNPFEAMDVMQRQYPAPEYELAWKVKTGSRKKAISSSFRNIGKKFLRRFDPEDRSSMLLVKGYDEEGHPHRVNILSEQLVYEEAALKVEPKDRSVTEFSAFQAIERAYENNREEIEQAGSLSSGE